MKTEHSYDGNGVLLDTFKEYIFVETYLEHSKYHSVHDGFIITEVNAMSRWDFLDMIEGYHKARTPKVEFDTRVETFTYAEIKSAVKEIFKGLGTYDRVQMSRDTLLLDLARHLGEIERGVNEN